MIDKRKHSREMRTSMVDRTGRDEKSIFIKYFFVYSYKVLFLQRKSEVVV